jgi:iron complex outermembrane receptor protein
VYGLGDDLGSIALHADWNWQTRSGDYSQPFGDRPSYGLLNAGIDWDEICGKPIDASFFVTNLTNKTYVLGIRTVYNTALGFAISRFGEPRMLGVRLRYHFGEE